jgi:hypothetical protein
MRPIIMFVIGASASLFILGYAVHMFVGGLVSRPAEITIIGIAEVIGASAIGWMTWDVLRRR